jgi:methionyl-tRNA formyltransferase
MERFPVTPPLRIALFGDGAWAADTATRLAEAGHCLAVVVLRRRPTGPELAARARQLGAPLLQPDDVNSQATVASLRAFAPDLGVSVAYDQILRRGILALPRLGCINAHAGKLPAYRGRNVINWAIINGETELGLTTHVVDEGIDTGPILGQCTVPIGWTDTYGAVLARAVQVLPGLVEETVASLARGEASPRPQLERGTYFPGRREGDEWIDWSATSARLHNLVRAITRPGPGALTALDGQAVRIWRAYWDPAWPRYLATPGAVVGREPGRGMLVKTGDSTLLVTEVQVGDSAPAMPHWQVGTRLQVAAAPKLEHLGVPALS